MKTLIRGFVQGALWTGFLIAGCSVISGSEGENYQHLLVMLCRAPPQIMGTILTTPELKAAWAFVCLHAESVPRTPVPQSQLNLAERQ